MTRGLWPLSIDRQRRVTTGSGTFFHATAGYRWYPIADDLLTDTAADAHFLGATVSSGDGDLWGGVGIATFTRVGNATLTFSGTATRSRSPPLPTCPQAR